METTLILRRIAPGIATGDVIEVTCLSPSDEGFPEKMLEWKARIKADTSIGVFCPCGTRMVLRAPKKQGSVRIVVARWPHRAHGPGCGGATSLKAPPKPAAGLKALADIPSVEEAFADEGSFDRTRLRLAPARDVVATELVEAISASSEPDRKPDTRLCHSMLGLLSLMVEFSKLNQWRPGPAVCENFDQVVPWLRGRCEEDEGYRKQFASKTVFMGVESDLPLALDRAIRSDETGLKNLGGRALVHGAMDPNVKALGDLVYVHDAYTVTLALSDAARRRLRNPRTRQLLAFTRSDRECRVRFVALLKPSGAGFEMEDISVCLMDRFGVLYDSVHEYKAAKALRAAGIPFAKPAITIYRVGLHQHRPDFLAFDSQGKQFIIEVDPRRNRGLAKKKIDRDLHYTEAGYRVVSWNPYSGRDLIELIREKGIDI